MDQDGSQFWFMKEVTPREVEAEGVPPPMRQFQQDYLKCKAALFQKRRHELLNEYENQLPEVINQEESEQSLSFVKNETQVRVRQKDQQLFKEMKSKVKGLLRFEQLNPEDSVMQVQRFKANLLEMVKKKVRQEIRQDRQQEKTDRLERVAEQYEQDITSHQKLRKRLLKQRDKKLHQLKTQRQQKISRVSYQRQTLTSNFLQKLGSGMDQRMKLSGRILNSLEKERKRQCKQFEIRQQSVKMRRFHNDQVKAQKLASLKEEIENQQKANMRRVEKMVANKRKALLKRAAQNQDHHNQVKLKLKELGEFKSSRDFSLLANYQSKLDSYAQSQQCLRQILKAQKTMEQAHRDEVIAARANKQQEAQKSREKEHEQQEQERRAAAANRQRLSLQRKKKFINEYVRREMNEKARQFKEIIDYGIVHRRAKARTDKAKREEKVERMKQSMAEMMVYATKYLAGTLDVRSQALAEFEEELDQMLDQARVQLRQESTVPERKWSKPYSPKDTASSVELSEQFIQSTLSKYRRGKPQSRFTDRTTFRSPISSPPEPARRVAQAGAGREKEEERFRSLVQQRSDVFKSRFQQEYQSLFGSKAPQELNEGELGLLQQIVKKLQFSAAQEDIVWQSYLC